MAVAGDNGEEELEPETAAEEAGWPVMEGTGVYDGLCDHWMPLCPQAMGNPQSRSGPSVRWWCAGRSL